jgi:hypothetical protein
MYQVYKIKETDLHAAALRTIKKAIHYMVIIYVCFNLYIICQEQFSIHVLLIIALGTLPAYTIALIIGYSLLKRTYRTFRIVLDDTGVEFYIRRNDKKIDWHNLQVVTKPDGDIELRDKHISALFRILTGEGSIQLFPEIERLDELRTEINKYKSYA